MKINTKYDDNIRKLNKLKDRKVVVKTVIILSFVILKSIMKQYTCCSLL